MPRLPQEAVMDDAARALRLRNGFLFVGHGLDHLVMLIYATAVLGLSKEFNLSFGELLPLSLGGFIAFGCCSLPAGWLADRWSRHNMMLVFFFGTGLCTIGAGFAQGPVQIAIALTAI